MDKIFEVKFDRDSLLRDHFRLIILGGSGSGKTTYALSLFPTFINRYKHIFLFTPILNKAYDNYIWPDHIFKIDSAAELEYKLSHLDQNLTKLIERRAITSNFLLILDDLGEYQLKAKKISSLMNVGRHINVSIVMLCQTYQHIPSTCRSSITHLCCCSVSDADVDNITKSMSLLSTKAIVRALSIMKAGSKDRKIFIVENTVFCRTAPRVCYDLTDQNIIDGRHSPRILLGQFSHMKAQLQYIIRANVNK